MNEYRGLRLIFIILFTLLYLSFVLAFNVAVQWVLEANDYSNLQKFWSIVRFQLLGTGLILYLFIIFCIIKISNNKDLFKSLLALVILIMLHVFVTAANAHSDISYYFMQVLEIAVTILFLLLIFKHRRAALSR